MRALAGLHLPKTSSMLARYDAKAAADRREMRGIEVHHTPGGNRLYRRGQITAVAARVRGDAEGGTQQP